MDRGARGPAHAVAGRGVRRGAAAVEEEVFQGGEAAAAGFFLCGRLGDVGGEEGGRVGQCVDQVVAGEGGGGGEARVVGDEYGGGEEDV